MTDLAFHFLRPWWFLAIVPLLLVLWRMSKKKNNQKGWAGVIDAELLPHVLISKEVNQRTWPKYLLGLMGILSIASLAGPVWEQLPQPVFRNESALVIAIDLSRSMDATDLKPSRLVRAKFKVADLLKQRKEGQTALLAFASDAFTVTPLTDDTATIVSQLKALSTDLMPQQGSRADRAMLKASDLLQQAGYMKGDILLITDGVNLERDQAAAKELDSAGYRLMILGVGTKEAAPIPDSRGGFFTDTAGNIILPSLDEAALKKLVKAGGGSYQSYTQNEQDVNRITLQLLERAPSESQASETDFKTDQWQEEGPWLLFVIIPFVAFAFRKGYLLIFVFIGISVTVSPETLAVDLWQRADQKAQQLLDVGEPEKAAEQFENKQWKGSAQYKAGDYEAALESWEMDESADALYNKGNAKAKQGQLEEAQELYKKTLKQVPDHEDAQHNLSEVEKALERKQQEQKNNESEGEEQENKKGDQEKKPEEGDGSSGDKEGEQEEPDEASANDQKESSAKEEQDKKQEEQSKSNKNEASEDDKKTEKETKAEEQASEDQQVEEQDREDSQQANSLDEEEQQAVEAALRAIPDDPGGLLRRKFKYQYQRQARETDREEQQW